MAISVTQLLQLILIAVGAIVVFGVLSGIVSSVSGESFACRLSVTLMSMGLSDSLNCRISQVDLPQRAFDRGDAERFLAEQMLECHSIYGASRDKPLRPQNWIDTSTALLRLSQGMFPEGRLFDNTRPILQRLPGGSAPRQYCAVCSVVTFPDGRSIDGFREYLVEDHFRGEPIHETLYAEEVRHLHYFEKNSDTFQPHDGEPARAVVFYTEGEIETKASWFSTVKRVPVRGVLAMNETDFTDMVSIGDGGILDIFNARNNLCQVYLT